MPLAPVLLLLCAVILVNGWTDAPNAITTPVSAGVLSFPAAAALAAVCNLFGVVCTAAVSDAVARTLWAIADFGPYALSALTAALSATVLWAVLAWRSGIPTSESHALVAGLSGAALALGPERLRIGPLLWVGFGLIFSLLLGWALGRLFVRLLPPQGGRFYRRGQIAGAALTAFLHGAQDGQKFLGVLALILTLEGGGFSLPGWAGWACAALMAAGTLVGGRRIVETVGEKMVRLTPRSGFAAELGCAAALGVCTLLGLPVSTTHAKTAAILGAGTGSPSSRWCGDACRRQAPPPNVGVVSSLGAAWLLTFPICGFLAYLLVKALMMW